MSMRRRKRGERRRTSDDRRQAREDALIVTVSPRYSPLTPSRVTDYTARPGSRVPMFTSRCTTPLACALAQPRLKCVGRSSAARFRVSGIIAATRHRFARTDDHMTTHTHLHTVRPRHAGDSRLAGSWCAPLGAIGAAAPWSIDAARTTRGSRMSQPSDRTQTSIEVTVSRTSEFGYRSLEAGRSGAGSGFRGDAP